MTSLVFNVSLAHARITCKQRLGVAQRREVFEKVTEAYGAWEEEVLSMARGLFNGSESFAQDRCANEFNRISQMFRSFPSFEWAHLSFAEMILVCDFHEKKFGPLVYPAGTIDALARVRETRSCK